MHEMQRKHTTSIAADPSGYAKKSDLPVSERTSSLMGWPSTTFISGIMLGILIAILFAVAGFVLGLLSITTPMVFSLDVGGNVLRGDINVVSNSSCINVTVTANNTLDFTCDVSAPVTQVAAGNQGIVVAGPETRPTVSTNSSASGSCTGCALTIVDGVVQGFATTINGSTTALTGQNGITIGGNATNAIVSITNSISPATCVYPTSFTYNAQGELTGCTSGSEPTFAVDGTSNQIASSCSSGTCTVSLTSPLVPPGNILPSQNSSYNLGSPTDYWETIYATDGTFSANVSIAGKTTLGGASDSFLLTEANGGTDYFAYFSILEITSTTAKPNTSIGLAVGVRTSDIPTSGHGSTENGVIAGAFYAACDSVNPNQRGAFARYSLAVVTNNSANCTAIGHEIDVAQMGPYTPYNSFSISFPEGVSAVGLVVNEWLSAGSNEWAGTGIPINPTSMAIGIISYKNNNQASRFVQHGKGIVFASDALLGTTGDGNGSACAMQMAYGHELRWIYDIDEDESLVIGSLATGNFAMRIYGRTGGIFFENINSDSVEFVIATGGGNATTVNYFQSNSAVTGSSPILQATGTDVNIPATIASQGSGSVKLVSNGVLAFAARSTSASAVNYVLAAPATTGNPPFLVAEGTDTNVPLLFQGRGTGTVLIIPATINAVGFSVQGASGQLADQQQWIIHSGTVQLAVNQAGHLSFRGGNPTIACGLGAGSNASCSVIGTDQAGYVQVNTSGTPTASAIIVTVTFAFAWMSPQAQGVQLTPYNSPVTGALGGTSGVFIGSLATDHWTIMANTVGLTTGQLYQWFYTVI